MVTTTTRPKKRTTKKKIRPPKPKKRRTKPSPEKTRDRVRKDIVRLATLVFEDYKKWAEAADVCPKTLENFIDGKCSWHRDTTVYKIAHAVGAEAWVDIR